jgi:Flp pilus assembly protein TadD
MNYVLGFGSAWFTSGGGVGTLGCVGRLRSPSVYKRQTTLWGETRRNKIFCLVLLFLFSVLSACESNPNENLATEHMNQGKLLLSRAEIAPAINEFQEALRLTPNWAVAHAQLARGLAAKGDISGAVTEYQTAVSLHPDSETFQQLGILLASSGNLQGGIAAFRSALQLQPADARLHYNLGMALRDNGNVDGAIDEYRKVVLYKATDYEARYQLGLALKEKGLREDALHELHLIMRETPDKPGNQKFLDLVRKSLATLE